MDAEVLALQPLDAPLCSCPVTSLNQLAPPFFRWLQWLLNLLLQPFPVIPDLLLDAGVVHAAGDIKGVAEEVAPLFR